jgi:hypothetical protein
MPMMTLTVSVSRQQTQTFAMHHSVWRLEAAKAEKAT